MKSLAALACTLGLLSAAAADDLPPAQAKELLQDIIANVRAHEQLYRDMIIRSRTEYKLLAPVYRKQHATENTTETTVVLQGEMVRLDFEQLLKTTYRERTCTTRLGFDGERTRVYTGQFAPAADEAPKLHSMFGNVREGRYESENIAPPHSYLLKRAWVRVPLSVVLEGTDALWSHGKARERFERNKRCVWSRLDGVETVSGMRCFRVTTKFWAKEQPQVHEYRVLWMAPERNYMPIKQVGRDDSDGDKAFATCAVEAWHEVRPGMWFPKRIRTEAVDQVLRKLERKYEPGTLETVTYSVELKPNYDVSYFRDIEFPPGTTVYRVDKLGNISFAEEIPGGPLAEAESRIKLPRWLLWTLINAAGVAALLVWYYWRRKMQVPKRRPA